MSLKKKALTDPVHIIPFKGQKKSKSERDNKKSVTPQKKTKPASITLNKEAKKLDAPTRKLNQSYLGINDLISEASKKKEKVQQKEEKGSRATDPFSIDELRMSWRKFAFKAKEEGIGTLYTAMIAHDPVLTENFTVNHTVDNDVQLGFIKSHETNLVSYLRKELNNYAIQLTIKEEASESGKLYSSKAKFEDMAERNPHLKTLRQKFKLDIDI
ncbi:hypothetical protein CW751_05745 [Brumimicrobium salinarum]|uniref:DNA polymerase III subunit gamma/tau n=1 Tax=Brumimicrobium salinarum TaxID=2058658 RepID=A0A2I0R3E4_9FLAO|nr:hypothetical protein [Brumimicrobium salinarum]PKR81085.1 hypothetical protein CW751_05745 [Brumimicrobium salinarum]